MKILFLQYINHSRGLNTIFWILSWIHNCYCLNTPSYSGLENEIYQGHIFTLDYYIVTRSFVIFYLRIWHKANADYRNEHNRSNFSYFADCCEIDL